MTLEHIALLMVSAPLIASILVGLNTNRIPAWLSQVITCGAMIASTACAWMLFKYVAIDGNKIHIVLLKWFDVDAFIANWAIYIDVLTAVMLIVVTTVSLLVHIYSIGYMAHDPYIQRFMSYLSLFTFFMLMLVSADNFMQLFFGWEGVGLSSYLLIGFWFKKSTANNAAIKAFLVNRVGDIGLALGVFLIFYVFNSVEFNLVFTKAATFSEDTIHIFGHDVSVLTVICLLLFIGCMGKSAQLGLHTWLPDAMEGPTPVSALIHAATMVTAGVFMLARCSPLFEYSPVALEIITVIGALTCIFAASIAMTQTDIKKIIAYSTCSQLGYMFFACGVSAYPAAIFHLTTHAFFKALLFLGAGSVIHAMSDEQEIDKMGGVWRKIPVTYAMMWIGSLALCGIFPFAGFYSKDAILEAAFSASGVGIMAYCLGLISALFTAFYSWRLLILVFHGKAHANHETMRNVHESPFTMLFPLFILAVGSIASGWYGVTVLNVLDEKLVFWKDSIVVLSKPKTSHHSIIIEYLPMLLGFIGIISSYMCYSLYLKKNYSGVFIARFPKLHTFIKNKGYFDEAYNLLFVQNSKTTGAILWNYVDTKFIDSLPNGMAALSLGFSKMISKFQSGYLYHYVTIMILSALIMLIIALNGLQLAS